MGGLRSNALRRAFRMDEETHQRAQEVARQAMQELLVSRKVGGPPGWVPFEHEEEVDEAVRTVYDTARGLALLHAVPEEAVMPTLRLWLEELVAHCGFVYGQDPQTDWPFARLCRQIDQALLRLSAALDESGQDLT